MNRSTHHPLTITPQTAVFAVMSREIVVARGSWDLKSTLFVGMSIKATRGEATG